MRKIILFWLLVFVLASTLSSFAQNAGDYRPKVAGAITVPAAVVCTTDAAKSTLTPASANLTADGSDQLILTVTAKDAAGNNVGTGGAIVTITKLSGTGTISSVTDVGNGTYTATITSPTSIGSGVFVATLGGNPVNSGTASQTQATITYVAGAVNAAASTLTPTSASITADGSSTQVLTVRAKDSNGNNVGIGGATVTIAKLSGIGAISSVTDVGDGTYTATVTSPTSTGSGVFVATLVTGGSIASSVKDGNGATTVIIPVSMRNDSVKSGGSFATQSTIKYTIGAPEAAVSTLTPTSANITANGSSTQVLTVTAKDAAGRNVGTGGAAVTITKISGTGTISSVTDVGDGTYTAIVTSPTSTGSAVFGATLGGNEVKSGTANQTHSTITYTAGIADAAISTLTPTSASITANGSSTQVLTVTAKDAAGNNIGTGGAAVTITKLSGTGTISSVTDVGNGTYTASVTSPTSTGNGVFVARIGGDSVKSGSSFATLSTIAYTVGAVDAAASTLTPISVSITANGSSTQVLTVTAKDANGNNVGTGGATVKIKIISGIGTISSVTDVGDGTYTAIVTSPTSTGSGVFGASLGGSNVNSGTASQTRSTITYTAGIADAAISTLTPTSASITANGTSTQVLTVTAKDANGNNVGTGGAAVTITKLSGTGTITSVTDVGNGTYIAIVTSPTSTGSGVFAARIGSDSVKSGGSTTTHSTITFAAGVPDAGASTLTPTSASITANGLSMQVLTVTAKDAAGNNIGTGGAAVTITKLSGTGTISSVTDVGNGIYTASVTSPTSTGSGVFAARIGSDSVKNGGSFATRSTITYTVGSVDAAASTLTPTSASITANGSSTQVLTVTAKDANGNNIGTGGAAVTITKLSGTGTISSVTDVGNGNYTATVTSPASTGNAVFGATLGGNEVKSGTANQTYSTITYTAGKADAAISTLTPTNASITANGSSTQVLTVTAKDAAGNNIGTGGAAVTITKLSGTGTISSVTDVGNGTYTATVTSPASKGNGLFAARIGGDSVKSGGSFATLSTITYAAGAATKYIVSASSSSPAAGSTITITAQLADVNNNAVNTSGNEVTWSKSNTYGSFASATSTTNGNGIATVFFTTHTGAGTSTTITGTDAARLAGTSGTITTTANTRSKLVFLQQPTNTTIGAAISPAISIQLQDQYGNNDTTSNVSVNIGLSYGSGLLSGANVVLTNRSGVATFAGLSINNSGKKVLTAMSTGLTLAISDTFSIHSVTSVFPSQAGCVPSVYSLGNNYPNPFNPQTKIRYSLPENAYVQLFIYDVLGRQVAELVNKEQPAGFYEMAFNGLNRSSGIYFYRINAQAQGKDVYRQVKKMILLK